MICRAEPNAIMLLSATAQLVIPSRYYEAVARILHPEYGGSEPISAANTAFLAQLEMTGFLPWMKDNREPVDNAMAQSAMVTAPENAYTAPTMLNLELTTRCPLHCPQCYCDLHRGKDMPLERAMTLLQQAAEMGVANINLSGGETMVYPHLYELLEQCRSLGLYAAVALSGYGVNEATLQKLITSGVSEIYVSLNGSTEDISRITRDGHDLAMQALTLLAQSGFENTVVNWVAHRSNVGDFANVAAICAQLGIKKLVVIGFKPDSSHSLAGAPEEEQVLTLAQEIRRLRKELPDLTIEVESCYSPLRALLGQRFFGNLNVGMSKGCGAGRDGASLDVDGNFTPCRHLDFPEAFDHLRDYWHTSAVLANLRLVEASPEEPCAGCRYGPYCLTCLAVSAKLQGRIAKANSHCFLWK